MTHWVETAALPEDTTALLQEQLINSIREVTKLRGEVRFGDLVSLPNDGKVVVDQRPVS